MFPRNTAFRKMNTHMSDRFASVSLVHYMLSVIVLVTFSCDKMPDKCKQSREGFIGLALRVEPLKTEEVGLQEPEAAAPVVSAVRKQREVNTGTGFIVLLSLETTPTE